VYDGDWLFRLSQLARHTPPRDGWRLPANVWGLGVTSLLTDISSEMVVSILPAYLVLTSGFAPLVLGLAAGLHEGGPMLATWLGGVVADRFGQRKLTAGAGYALSAISRLAWWMFSSPTAAGVATFVVADRAGKSIRTAPRDAMISLSVGRDQLATAFGVHRALDAAGAAAGPALAFALLWALPRRYDVIFFTSFVIALLGLAALSLLVDERAQQLAAVPAGRRVWAEGFALFGDIPLRQLLILAAAFGLVTISDAFIYLLLVQRSHASAVWIPLLYTGTAISFLTLAIPIGALADRIGRRRIFVAGHGGLLLVYVMTLSTVPVWPWNALVCVILLGAFYASSEGVLASLAGDLLPADVRATGLAWVATSLSAARLGGALMFGFLWTRAGDIAAVAVFAVALSSVLAAFAFFRRRDAAPVPA
jgi:MFS family permease